METSPKLDPWAWISGAHQQYHYALLLCMEIFALPNLPDANRIWTCLDYVFEVPPHLTQEQKSRWILTEVRDRTELFASSRKVRAPTGLVDRLAQQTPLDSGEPNNPSASRGKIPRFNTSRVDLTQNITAGEAMRDQYMSLQQGHGFPSANLYHPTSVPTQTAPARDDRMVDIDWVSVPRRRIACHEVVCLRIFQHEWDKLFPPLGQPTH